jgi:mRNA interferase MazF
VADFPRRGEIHWVDLDPTRGSEQAGKRPAVIVSNDVMNQHGAVVVIAPMTTTIPAKKYPQNVHLPAGRPLEREGVINCGQIRTVAKDRLDGHRADLSPEQIAQVEEALAAVFGLKLAA